MKVTLVTFSRKGARKDFAVESASMLIGRKSDADLRIPLEEVSREHCRLSVNGKKVVLHDLDSSNGTFVNDQRIVQAALKAGDRIKIGPVVFTVQIDGQPTKISPPAQLGPPAPSRPAKKAAPEAPTEMTPVSSGAGADEEIDLDSLEELNLDDVSDMDLGDLDVDKEDLEEVEEVEEVEELDEDDLEVDEDSGTEVAK